MSVDKTYSPGRSGLIILRKSVEPAHLGLQVVDFQPLGLAFNRDSDLRITFMHYVVITLITVINYLTPILGQMLDPLEGGDELETHKALLVALDVLEQELVLGDVGIAEVELHLLDCNHRVTMSIVGPGSGLV